MYYVYILKSLNSNGYYTGHAKDIYVRLKKHNDGRVTSTKNKRPWQIIHTENFNTKQEAYQREKQIKSYKGGEAFKKLIK